LAGRYDSDLASGLGNYVSRILALTKGVEMLTVGNDLKVVFDETWKSYHRHFAANEPGRVLEVIWQVLKEGDRYIDECAPWALKKDAEKTDELAVVLGTLIESLRQLAWLLTPFMPETAMKIFTSLGWQDELKRSLTEASVWGAQTHGPVVATTDPLFPRLTA